MAEMLNIEVCYALSGKQEIVRVKLPEGASLQQALEASGMLDKYPDIELKKNKFLLIRQFKRKISLTQQMES